MSVAYILAQIVEHTENLLGNIAMAGKDDIDDGLLESMWSGIISY
jgi:hypothetical protein